MDQEEKQEVQAPEGPETMSENAEAGAESAGAEAESVEDAAVNSEAAAEAEEAAAENAEAAAGTAGTAAAENAEAAAGTAGTAAAESAETAPESAEAAPEATETEAESPEEAAEAEPSGSGRSSGNPSGQKTIPVKEFDEMCLDLIQFAEGIRKTAAVYDGREFSEANYRKLLRITKGLYQDIQDVLYRNGVEPYSIEGDEVNARRQTIIDTVPTEDEEKNNRIAERTADGYQKDDGTILRKERVKIFRYQKPAGA